MTEEKSKPYRCPKCGDEQPTHYSPIFKTKMCLACGHEEKVR